MNTSPMGPVPQLIINSNAPKAEKYSAAWALLGDRKARPEARAHAKCWLTYRAVEGEVRLYDWDEKVKPAVVDGIQDNIVRYRWETSQQVAEVYLNCLNGREWLAFASLCSVQDMLPHLPNLCTNMLRMNSLRAYARFLDGDIDTPLCICHNSIQLWQKQMGNMKITDEPTRWYEVGNDAAPLHVLMTLYAKCNGTRLPHDVTFDEQTRALPWWRCMRKLAKDKTLFV